jgi:chromate transporter
MSKLIALLNTFAMLSLLAVGGGTAVLPQMEHESVQIHHWVTAQEFTSMYSLGQLAPGPNMTMVALIGLLTAGIPGAIVVILGFFVPSCLLTYVVSNVWDKFAGSPWRDAVQAGMAPITIGLMLGGVYAVGKTATFSFSRPLEENLITIAIGLAVAIILFLRRVNPALLILAGGVLGFFVLR